MSETRYLVGIDLGTTNSAVGYVDLDEGHSGRLRPRLFEVPQLVAPGEIAPREGLPSFLYFALPEEARSGALRVDWAREASPVAGLFARDRGALLPTRQVASAKSWLSYAAADRTAPILPWGADEPLISPVDASARLLAWLRDAWDHAIGAASGNTLDRLPVVLTVPASFDEEARELTLAAARGAGLAQVTLLEEPLAAFYAWIASHRSVLKKHLRDGQRLLVCDVGGGTTDFTMIDVCVAGGQISFERSAVGEHLLLGGDNLDLALARGIEHRLGDQALTLVQRLALRRSVSGAKERLLSDEACELVPITLLGSGRSVVGGTRTVQLRRHDVVEALMDGFLPVVPAEARPRRDRRLGLRELGLPYADDPAITRHLAAFLEVAAAAAGRGREAPGAAEDAAHPTKRMVRPDAVLFNGGFFTPELARQRMTDAIGRWFDPAGSWRPTVLENRAPAAAVALGAAAYALVRHAGQGVRVRAGSARGYYVGVGRTEAPEGANPPPPGDAPLPTAAVCILPRGTEEGTTFDLGDRRFAVATNQPVSFPLYSSTTRRDAAGDLVAPDESWAHTHAPLTSVMRYGRKSRHAQIDVSLRASYTETGTLEVSCASRASEHRWALRFQLRGEREADLEPDAGEEAGAIVPKERLDEASAAIASVFSAAGDAPAEGLEPEALPSRLEATIGFARPAWPLGVIRALADRLLERADFRRRGARYEARWLNLLGFCLRPGFGSELDEWRIGKTRGLYAEGLAFGSDLQCQVEWIVLWQRVAGGLRAGQQRELYQRYATLLEVKAAGRPKRLNAQVEREGWRLLASLEHLAAREREALGDSLLRRLAKEPDNASYLWAIGRLGARTPAYGPTTSVVPAERAEAWIEQLFRARSVGSDRAAAIAQVGACSNDPLRDIGREARARAVERLLDAGHAGGAELLRTYVPPAGRDALQVFGETLPVGLRLVD